VIIVCRNNEKIDVLPSSQLKTRTSLPKTDAKALTLSVFPVPAGPVGLPPNPSFIACVRAKKHFSVKGVLTKPMDAP